MMSMMNPRAKAGDLGEVIASTRDYEVAQKTVSTLIAAEVPARDIAIVGEGVRTVERVTGKLGYAAAARSGAINGVLIGLLLSAIMLFGTPDAQLTLFLGFILVGVALGMIMSLITYSIVRRRRDFASMTQMLAEHYEVRVQSASLTKARQALGGAQKPMAARPPVDLSEPPRYGERVPTPGQGPASGTPTGSGVPAGPVLPPKPPVPSPGPDAGGVSDAVSEPPRYGERVPTAGQAPTGVAAPESSAPESSAGPVLPPKPPVPSQAAAPSSAVPDAGGVTDAGSHHSGGDQAGGDPADRDRDVADRGGHSSDDR